MNRTMLGAVLALFLALPVIAGGDPAPDGDRPFDDLFSPDAAVRQAARTRVLAMGVDAMPELLESIEAHARGRTKPMVLEVYDVRDLVPEGSGIESLRDRAAGVAGGGADVKVEGGGSLVVTATRAGQERVGKALRDLRSGRERVVTLEMRLIRIEEGRRPEMIAAPRLTTYPGQEATLSIGGPGRYVEPVDGARAVVDEAGVRVGVRADLAGEGLRLAVEVHVARVAAGPAPEMREVVLRTSVDLADGGTALLCVGHDPEGGRLFLEIGAQTLDLRGLAAREGDDIGLEPR